MLLLIWRLCSNFSMSIKFGEPKQQISPLLTETFSFFRVCVCGVGGGGVMRRGEAAPEGLCPVMELNLICKGFSQHGTEPDAAPSRQRKRDDAARLSTHISINYRRHDVTQTQGFPIQTRTRDRLQLIKKQALCRFSERLKKIIIFNLCTVNRTRI